MPKSIKAAPTPSRGHPTTAANFHGKSVSTAETGGTSRASSASVDQAAPLLPSREECIRLAAYAAAEQRGFAPGFETQDWLDAERQIDSEMEARAPGSRSA